MINKKLNDLISLHETAGKGHGDREFLSLLETFIENKIIDIEDTYHERLSLSSDEEKEEIPLLNYLNGKAQYTDYHSALFLNFINKYYPSHYNQFSTLNAIAEQVSKISGDKSRYTWGLVNQEEDEKNIKKLKDMIEKITPEQLLSLIETENYEQNIYESHTVSGKIQDLRGKFLNNEVIRDIFIEKIGSLDFIYKNATLVQLISVDSFYYFENAIPGFWEKETTLLRDVRDKEKNEWVVEQVKLSVLELIINQTQNAEYEPSGKNRIKRTYLYENVYPSVSQNSQNIINKSVFDYMKNDYPLEILSLPEWYLLGNENINIFEIMVKETLKAENSERTYHYGFSTLIHEIENDEDFKNFVVKQEHSLFSLVLEYDYKTRFEYLDRSFKLEERKHTPINFEEIFYRGEIYSKLSKLVKKYGIENVLGTPEEQDLFIESILNLELLSTSKRSAKYKKFLDNLNEINQTYPDKLSKKFVSLIFVVNYLDKLIEGENFNKMEFDNPESVNQIEWPKALFIDAKPLKESTMIKKLFSFKKSDAFFNHIDVLYEKNQLQSILSAKKENKPQTRL